MGLVKAISNALSVVGVGSSDVGLAVPQQHGGNKGEIMRYSQLPQRVSYRDVQRIEAEALELEQQADNLGKYQAALGRSMGAATKIYGIQAKHVVESMKHGARVAEIDADFRIASGGYQQEVKRQRNRITSYERASDRASGIVRRILG